jgi:hypothetical protein
VIPAAALAVVAAAHEDARRAHGSTRYAATLAAKALTDAGWTIAPSAPLPGRQTGTQDAA